MQNGEDSHPPRRRLAMRRVIHLTSGNRHHPDSTTQSTALEPQTDPFLNKDARRTLDAWSNIK
jgi:hypothetical protein